jgi:hypothetical protein
MNDIVNRFARELADAIAAAVAENPQVEACREKARAAGFEMKLTLEAVVGFVSRSQTGGALAKVAAPARPRERNGGSDGPAAASKLSHGQRSAILPRCARSGRNHRAGRVADR